MTTTSDVTTPDRIPAVDLNEYQGTIRKFYKFAPEDHTVYSLFGLTEEVGEVMSIFAKNIRAFPSTSAESIAAGFADMQSKEDLLKKELGDVYFQITSLIDSLGWSVEEIASLNVAKLESRLNRGVIQGSGDAR